MVRGAKINGAMKGYGLGVSVGAASYRHCWGLRLRTSSPVFYLPPSARMAVPHGRHRQDHNQGISQGDGAGRSRQQLPPQIRKVEIFDRGAGKTVVKYQLRVDGGVANLSKSPLGRAGGNPDLGVCNSRQVTIRTSQRLGPFIADENPGLTCVVENLFAKIAGGPRLRIAHSFRDLTTPTPREPSWGSDTQSHCGTKDSRANNGIRAWADPLHPRVPL
jgi:hypothetical protein